MIKASTIYQRGIGLLELMLSLAIIALLLVMATRYYSSAHGSQQLNTAVEAFHAIYAAAETYEANDPNANLTDLSPLVSANLLPQVFSGTGSDAGKLANPWGGEIGLTVTAPTSGNPQSILISMYDVPDTQCGALIASLAQTLSSADKVGPGTSGLYSASEVKSKLAGGDACGTGSTGGSTTVSVEYFN